jgi:class III poly(R)-hydroxyalkanoic acid synthase PhaE subunit
MFKAMQGPGAQGFDQWTEGAKPFLDAWRREGKSILGMPAFGSGREQQERLQRLMQAQLDFQQREGAYNALMMKALQRAYGVFQDKLAEREEPGRQLTSARALFDLWIDAAEEAYAQVALSPEFREVYGAYANAQMRLRNGMQREVEQACAAIGMPTRTEVDAAHRKIAELERVLRRMRDAGEGTGNAAHPESRAATASTKPAAASKPAAKRTVANKKKPATKPAPTARRKR